MLVRQSIVSPVDQALVAAIEKLSAAPTPDNLKALQDLSAMQRSRPWMSEFWTLVLAVPMVLAFFPPMTATVQNGYLALSHVPDWVRWLIGGSVTLAFGIRVGTVASAFGARKTAPPPPQPQGVSNG